MTVIAVLAVLAVLALWVLGMREMLRMVDEPFNQACQHVIHMERLIDTQERTQVERLNRDTGRSA